MAYGIDTLCAIRYLMRVNEKLEDQAMGFAEIRSQIQEQLDSLSICEKCGGEAKIIASIEDQAVIDKILHHLQV